MWEEKRSERAAWQQRRGLQQATRWPSGAGSSSSRVQQKNVFHKTPTKVCSCGGKTSQYGPGAGYHQSRCWSHWTDTAPTGGQLVAVKGQNEVKDQYVPQEVAETGLVLTVVTVTRPLQWCGPNSALLQRRKAGSGFGSAHLAGYHCNGALPSLQVDLDALLQTSEHVKPCPLCPGAPPLADDPPPWAAGSPAASPPAPGPPTGSGPGVQVGGSHQCASRRPEWHQLRILSLTSGSSYWFI